MGQEDLYMFSPEFSCSTCDGPPLNTERNRNRRHRKAHEKAWKAQTRWEGRAAHGAPQRRRQANELARATRDQKIKKRGRGRS